MRYSNPTTQRASEMVNNLLRILFFAFCFLYIYHFQDGLLSFAQHYYSGGRTDYSPFTSAFLSSALLTSLGVVLSYFLVIPLYVRALAWMPSCLFLAMLTDVNVTAVFHYHQGAYWWTFFLYFLLFIALMLGAYQLRDNTNLSGSKLSFISSNLAILTLLLFMVSWFSNTDEYQHRLLSLEQKVIEGDDEDVLETLQSSPTAKENLLPLEAYVLARNGKLPDELFVSGHFTSSNQLLPSYDDTLRAVALPKRLQEYLGVALDSSSQTNAIQYLRTITNDTLCRTTVEDYLLCAYLLDRKLRNFAEYINRAYDISDSLPMRYREALVLYSSAYPRSSSVYTNDSLSSCLYEFQQGRFANAQEQADTLLTQDSIQRIATKYADTYWHYYYR